MYTHRVKWNCSECAAEFSYKKNLYAHERKFHKEMKLDLNKKPVVKCNKCAAEFHYKKNLYAHERNFHKTEKKFTKKNPIVKCTECAAEFGYKKNLYVHEKKFHNKTERPVPQDTVKMNKCDKCKSMFSLKRNLNAHIRKVHKQDCLECRICHKVFILKSKLQKHESLHKTSRTVYETEHSYAKIPHKKCRILCPQETCTTRFSTHKHLRRHLMTSHNIEVLKEEHEFTSLESFENWKCNVQQEGMSCFSLDSGPKKLSADDEAWKLYYNCHRSYSFIAKGKDVRKSMGSNKIGKACPSRMEVSMVGRLKQPSTIKVIYWKTHLGHALQIGHVFLDSKIKTEIKTETMDNYEPYSTMMDNNVTKKQEVNPRLKKESTEQNFMRDSININYNTILKRAR